MTGVIFFTKMRGNGDEFIVIDNRQYGYCPAELATLARDLCLEKNTLASGGLLVFEKTRDPSQHFFMRAFNCDGTEEPLSGNGARCLAGLAFQIGIAPQKMVFGFSRGTVHATVEPVLQDPAAAVVTLDMGEVDLTQAKWHQTFSFWGETFLYHALSISDIPHCVILLDHLGDMTPSDLVPLARGLRFDTKRFPEGTNVSFLERDTEGQSVRLLTYQRKVNRLTSSCGTAIAAGGIVACLSLDYSSPVKVITPGGTSEVAIKRDPLAPQKVSVALRGEALCLTKGTILFDARSTFRTARTACTPLL
jgi:diaminopimelate epimerase